MEGFLDHISNEIGNNLWLAPIMALLAGVLTSLMPCSLSTVPLVIGCVGGSSSAGKRALWLSILFALGSSITFLLFGIVAALAGMLLDNFEFWLHLILGIVLILMALQMWDVIEIIPSSTFSVANRLRGCIGAFLAGLLAGVFSAHCASPMIVALLAIVIDRGHILYGIVLFLLFSIGHGILSVIAGTSLGLVQRITESEKYERFSRIIRICLGVIIALTALWLLWEAISEGLLHSSHDH